MFNIYTYANGWEKHTAYSKQEEINKLIDLSNKYKTYHFITIEIDKKRIPNPHTILNEQDFKNYLQDFKLRQETCLELKNEITKYVKIKSL